MAIHVWVAWGARIFALSAGSAALASLTAVLVSSAYFRSWTMWTEWYTAVFGRNPYLMARPPSGGNYSTAVLVSRWLGADVWAIAGIIAALLLISLVAALAWSARWEGSAWAGLRRAAQRLFGDPALAMAIGVTATIALPHLVWYHYYLIALIPSLWLLGAPSGSRYLAVLGFAAIALGSGLPHVFLVPLGFPELAALGAALSWIPLWAGILVHLYTAGSSAPEASAMKAPTPAPERPAHGEPPARRPKRTRSASRA